jgi:hypothetical protein
MNELRIAPEYVDGLSIHLTTEKIRFSHEKLPGDSHTTFGSDDPVFKPVCRGFLAGFSAGYRRGWEKFDR